MSNEKILLKNFIPFLYSISYESILANFFLKRFHHSMFRIKCGEKSFIATIGGGENAKWMIYNEQNGATIELESEKFSELVDFLTKEFEPGHELLMWSSPGE